MTPNELIDISIAPHNQLTEELVQRVARVLNQDAYHIRTLLYAKIPRIISQETDIQKIEEILKQMETLGFATFSGKDAEIQKPISIFKANTLEFGEQSIIFGAKNGQIFKLAKKNVFLILKGVLKTYEEKEVITKVKKLNVMATLLTGGIPIKRTVQETKINTTTQNEGYLRLFEGSSMDFCVEIKQYGFNYSCLGAEMTSSSLINIKRIGDKFKAFFPAAEYNEDLCEVRSMNISPNSPQENIDIDSKLIYLYYQALKSRRSN